MPAAPKNQNTTTGSNAGNFLKRKNTIGPSAGGGGGASGSTPKAFVLAAGQLYHFSCDLIGRFRIRGGATSNAILDGHRVTIRDLQGNLLFSEGGPNDRVTLTDDTEDQTTTVRFIPGGTEDDSPQKVKCYVTSTKVQYNKNGTTTVTTTEKVTYDGPSDDSTQSDANDDEEAFQAVATASEHIVITGSRAVAVTGLGGYLEVTGESLVQFRGDPQSVIHKGSGDVTISGDVKGHIVHEGTGTLEVTGNVSGNIVLGGQGTIDIKGQHLAGTVVNISGNNGSIKVGGRTVGTAGGSGKGGRGR